MNQPTRLFDFIYHQKAHFPQKRAFTYRNEGVETQVYSTDDMIEMANRVSRSLYRMGLRPGDKIATAITKNRPEWMIMDLGMMQIGVANVPVYPTIAPSDYEYIFNDAQVKYCFFGDDGKGDLFKRISNAQKNTPSVQKIFAFDKVDYAPHWSEIWKNDAADDDAQSAVEAIKEGIKPDDLSTIIYTSGTTGVPKGVMLSHDNLVSNVTTVMELIPINAGERGLSFLPLNHIFEKACSYAYMLIGAEVIFTGVDNLGGETGDLQAVKPHFFTTVPRLLEKVYEKIYNKGLELKGLKRGLFFWALKLADSYEYDKEYSGLEAIKVSIANKLIFSKWRAALGGNVKGIVVGASACPVKIARVFSFAGIPVREGYGMTETSPGISISRFDKNGALLGAVGPALSGVDILLDSSDGNYAAGEGEVLAAGRNVMLGYYNKPEETEKVIKIIDGKRYMCTGDIGRFEEKNGVKFLKITDRKKELFKTTGGKYVAPAPIENKLREHFLIEQVMVVGDNQKFVSAIITPAQEALQDYCKQHEIAWTNLAEVLQNEQVVQKYDEVIAKYNPNFANVEQVKAFRLVPDTWEPVKADGSQGELTPTMKLKRRVILEKYDALLGDIYK